MALVPNNAKWLFYGAMGTTRGAKWYYPIGLYVHTVVYIADFISSGVQRTWATLFLKRACHHVRQLLITFGEAYGLGIPLPLRHLDGTQHVNYRINCVVVRLLGIPDHWKLQ